MGPTRPTPRPPRDALRIVRSMPSELDDALAGAVIAAICERAGVADGVGSSVTQP